jgi:GxxExxY protein
MPFRIGDYSGTTSAVQLRQHRQSLKIGENEEAQILNYLKASKLSPGLLINFGARSLQHKRFVYDF